MNDPELVARYNADSSCRHTDGVSTPSKAARAAAPGWGASPIGGGFAPRCFGGEARDQLGDPLALTVRADDFVCLAGAEHQLFEGFPTVFTGKFKYGHGKFSCIGE